MEFLKLKAHLMYWQNLLRVNFLNINLIIGNHCFIHAY